MFERCSRAEGPAQRSVALNDRRYQSAIGSAQNAPTTAPAPCTVRRDHRLRSSGHDQGHDPPMPPKSTAPAAATPTKPSPIDPRTTRSPGASFTSSMPSPATRARRRTTDHRRAGRRRAPASDRSGPSKSHATTTYALNPEARRVGDAVVDGWCSMSIHARAGISDRNSATMTVIQIRSWAAAAATRSTVVESSSDGVPPERSVTARTAPPRTPTTRGPARCRDCGSPVPQLGHRPGPQHALPRRHARHDHRHEAPRRQAERQRHQGADPRIAHRVRTLSLGRWLVGPAHAGVAGRRPSSSGHQLPRRKTRRIIRGSCGTGGHRVALRGDRSRRRHRARLHRSRHPSTSVPSSGCSSSEGIGRRTPRTRSSRRSRCSASCSTP